VYCVMSGTQDTFQEHNFEFYFASLGSESRVYHALSSSNIRWLNLLTVEGIKLLPTDLGNIDKLPYTIFLPDSTKKSVPSFPSFLRG